MSAYLALSASFEYLCYIQGLLNYLSAENDFRRQSIYTSKHGPRAEKVNTKGTMNARV